MPGAPEGNTNSSRDNRLWGNTIRRLAAQDPEKLRKIGEKLFAMAEAGDIQAMRELADRLDGKAAQSLAVTGADGGPVQYQEVALKIVDPRD